jgi:hypothetical protein
LAVDKQNVLGISNKKLETFGQNNTWVAAASPCYQQPTIAMKNIFILIPTERADVEPEPVSEES